MPDILTDRRGLLKVLGAAGVTAAFLSACSPSSSSSSSSAQPTTAPAAKSSAPAATSQSAAEPAAAAAPAGKGWIQLSQTGPDGNPAWKYGDAKQFAPPFEIPAGPAADLFASLPKAKLLDIYTKMVTSRQWETTMKDLWVAGDDKLYGAFHPYIGQEAIAVGVMAALNPDDYIASTHRGHGHLIAKGGDINKMAAEIFAKKTGYNLAFGGSMHITDLSKYILGMNGIVGAAPYMAAGAALSARIRKTKQVAVAFGGDGSAPSPYTYSAVRSAVNYKLPFIFVIENNFQFIAVPTSTVIPTKTIADMYKGFGLPCVTVDGNDITAVYQAAKNAVDRARAGEGPSVIEAITYRWYDHAGFAGAKVGVDGAFGLPYRPDDEVQTWMTRDPIKRLASFLTSRNLVTQAELDKIAADVKAAVNAAVDFARKSPGPDPASAITNVYAQGTVPATQFFGRKPF